MSLGGGCHFLLLGPAALIVKLNKEQKAWGTGVEGRSVKKIKKGEEMGQESMTKFLYLRGCKQSTGSNVMESDDLFSCEGYHSTYRNQILDSDSLQQNLGNGGEMETD